MGRSLWREDGFVVYNCYWPSSAESFSGPSLLGLATTFYCVRFESFLFVASNDSQGYEGGIRPRLHTGYNPRQIHYSYLITWEQANSAGDNKKKYAIKIVIDTHMRGTRIEKEIEIYATNLANETKRMSTNA
jgi:hypothetical protein